MGIRIERVLSEPPVIEAVNSDSPLKKHLKPGDTLTHVQQRSTQGMPMSEIKRLLRSRPTVLGVVRDVPKFGVLGALRGIVTASTKKRVERRRSLNQSQTEDPVYSDRRAESFDADSPDDQPEIILNTGPAPLYVETAREESSSSEEEEEKQQEEEESQEEESQEEESEEKEASSQEEEDDEERRAQREREAQEDAERRAREEEEARLQREAEEEAARQEAEERHRVSEAERQREEEEERRRQEEEAKRREMEAEVGMAVAAVALVEEVPARKSVTFAEDHLLVEAHPFSDDLSDSEAPAFIDAGGGDGTRALPAGSEDSEDSDGGYEHHGMRKSRPPPFLADHLAETNRRLIVSIVDGHATQATSPLATAGLKELSAYLVAPFASESEPLAVVEMRKIRCIVRWVSHNIEYNTTTVYDPDDPAGAERAEVVLETRKAHCLGYCNLIRELAALAGLSVHVIHGWQKGPSYRPGDTIDFVKTDHAWISATIALRDTYLIDPMWASGRSDGTTFVREWDEQWFTTPPEDFIFQHFPQDPADQSLRPPVNVQTFLEMAALVPNMTAAGVEMMSHTKGVVPCEQQVAIEFTVLMRDAGKLNVSIVDIDANCFVAGDSGRYVIQSEPVSGSEKLLFRPPHPGSYVVNVFVDDAYVMKYTVAAAFAGAPLGSYPVLSGNSQFVELEPLTRELTIGEEVVFKYRAPADTHALQIHQGEEVAAMTAVEGDPELFQTTARIVGPAGAPITLRVRYEAGDAEDYVAVEYVAV